VSDLIISVSGLRGVVGESLTPDVAIRYASAFVAGLPPGPVVLGRDGRESGPTFVAAIGESLRAAGRDVLDGGVAATPTVGLLVRTLAAAGGIQISASHNPPQYNGLKLFGPSGRVLTADEGRRVLTAYERAEAPPRSPVAGSRQDVDGGPAHLERVLGAVDVRRIRDAGLRVWLDAGHGAGSRLAVPLLEALGCELILEGGSPDGRFEHPPEPTEENLAALLPRIPASRCDVGFFQDPDADRLAIATAEGRFIGEEATLPLAVEAVLARRPGPVVVNCSTSGMTAVLARRFGVACHVAAVGEANVVERMVESAAVIGGEGNGGVIDPRVGYVRDSFIGMALVLERMAGEGGPFSLASLADRLPRRVMRKTKIELGRKLRTAGLTAALEGIERAFPEAVASRLDGLRLDAADFWLLIRASNTEPILRIVAEAERADVADAAIARAREALGEFLADD